MGLFSSIRIAPGVRLSTSSRGLRLHAGPRFARVHVGGGRTGVSTGAGPFTWYEGVSQGGSSTSRAASNQRPAPTMTPAQAERARQIAEVSAAWERLRGMHRVAFVAASEPGPVAPEPVPLFGVLLHQAEAGALKGVSLFDRRARADARAAARQQAEAEALALLEQGLADLEDRQGQVDAEWAALCGGDPAVTTRCVSEAFAARGMSVVVDAPSADTLALSLVVSGAEALPTHEPSVTPGGAPTLKKITKTQISGHVRELVAAQVLLAAKEALAVSPATRVVTVDACFAGARVVLRAALDRDFVERAPWSLTAWEVLAAIDPHVEVNVGGRTQELRPLP